MNKRQQIIDAIETRLAAITGVRGAHVWRKTPVTAADCPCLLIFDTSADTSVKAYPIRDHALTVEILGFATTSISSSKARQLADDIYTAIGIDDTWGGLALRSEPANHALDLEPAGDITAAVKISLTVTYRTELWRI